jgi:MscS family membrane protein
MKKLLLALLLVVASAPAICQGIPGLLKSTPAAPAAPEPDPLGRATPYGSVFGFLHAAQANNYVTAAAYLQLNAGRRQSQGPELARKLKDLMDRGFRGGIRHISNNPEGSQDPSVGMGREVIGNIESDDEDVPVVLVRVDDPGAGQIWLFSADTLSHVPDLYDNLKALKFEKSLPNSLVQNLFLGVPLWQWVGLLLAIPVAVGIAFLAIGLLAIPRRLWLQYRKKPNLRAVSRLTPPLLIFFGAIAHRILVAYLRLPLLPRTYYFRTIGVVIEIGFFWVLLRASGLMLQRWQVRAISMGRTGTSTLLVLAQRLTTALIVIIAVLSMLSTIGFNLTTVLAGLGIGGIAIAFAAQKTLENLFGGVSVLADEVIRVGDTCRFGDRVGTVEDISLRSTRIRTPERGELSIPNGALATMNIDNLTRRDKMLFNPNIALRYETSVEQLQYVLANLRRMFYEHPRVENETARVRLLSLDPSSITIELMAYVMTRDWNEFTAIREDLLFRVMKIVREAGTGFALPSQTMYSAQDQGLHPEKTLEAERRVKAWREQKQLPFPDFGPAEKAKFADSLVYPDPDSALNQSQR